MTAGQEMRRHTLAFGGSSKMDGFFVPAVDWLRGFPSLRVLGCRTTVFSSA